MIISELARKAGVTKDTVRHYEQLGLLASRPRPAGSRRYGDYDDDSVLAIDKVRRLQRLGFSLAEIRTSVQASVTTDCSPEHTREMLDSKLGQLLAKRAELDALIGTVREHLSDRSGG